MKDLQVETNWILAMFYRILHFSPTRRPQDNQMELTLKEALSMLELSIDHLHKLSTQRFDADNREKTEIMVRYNIQWMNFALESIGQKIDTPEDLTTRVRGLSEDTSDLLGSVYRALPGIEDGLTELNQRITENLSDFMGTHPVPGRPAAKLITNL